MRVVPKDDGACPNCSQPFSAAAAKPWAQSAANPYKSPVSPSVPGTSNVRGCGFGCLYILGSWFGFGIVAALLIPAVFYGPKWNHEAIGALASGLILVLVSIPLGVFGFIRHRRNRP